MAKSKITIIFSIFYILGAISFFTGNVILVSALLLAVLIIGLYKNIISYKAALLFYILFATALLNCHLQIKNSDDLSQYIPSKGEITGIVETLPTTNSIDKTKFYLKVKSVNFKGEKKDNINARTIVTLYDTKDKFEKIKIGDKIKLEGMLRQPIKAKNPSQFDYSNYLKNHKTFSTFTVKSKYSEWKIVSVPETLGGKFLQKLNDKRTEILNIHKRYVKSPNIEVLGGVVFGDDAINPPNDIKSSFINSGLLHILAASGMNVSIIFGIWFFIASRLKLNYRFIILTGALLVAFYTLMTGMGPSVLRAAIMIEFVLLGKLIDRAADSVSLVFFVAFLMLLYNPAMINDVGFQLSFVVTFALMLYCPPVFEKIKNKFVEFAAGAVMIPIVAQFWAAPIQMFYFNTFATYSILANFAITPFIMIISFLGFLGSIIAMIPIPFIADKTCMIFDFVLNPVVTILINISKYFSSLPNSLLTTVHPNIFQLCIYYGILLAFGLAIRDGFKRKRFMAGIIITAIIFALTFVKFDNKECEILVFDVGNADSFLIKTPEKKYILIDTSRGPVSATFSIADAIINKYMKDNGIKTLDLMIITHFDSDHSGGAVDIMEAVNVKKAVINKDVDGTKITKAILGHLEKHKINYTYASDKETVLEEKNLKITTFAPEFKVDKNDNDDSIITLLSYGDFDMLFMGDAGVRSFNKIKSNLPDNIEVLKVGHHGAKNTVDNKMLKALNLDTAVISTGMNYYGHPNKNTLRTLSDNNLKIYRTDINNAIKIKSDGKNYEVSKYNTVERTFDKDIKLPCRHVSAIIGKN